MDGRDGEKIQSVQEMILRFHAEILGKAPAWSDRLQSEPSGLEAIETSVHHAFARIADMVVVGLIAMTIAEKTFNSAAEQTRK